jgi:soluble lytic murein transglycosylase
MTVLRKSWMCMRRALAGLMALMLLASAAYAQDAEVFAIRVLDAEDIALYQQIVDAQTRTDWATADRLMKRLKNREIIGHLLYERYMHPTAYRSSFQELASWMSKYADQPGAERIYRLAQRRRPKGAALKAPVPLTQKEPAAETQYSPQELKVRRARAAAQSAIRTYLRKGAPTQAEQHFWTADKSALFSKEQFGRTLASIAASYLYAGNDDKAISLGTVSAASEGRGRFSGNWVAGLAEWRKGNCQKAADHFERATEVEEANPWEQSGAAFWAARSRLACRQPELVTAHLDRAAHHSRTFYGMVAARQLGRDIAFSWEHPPFHLKDYNSIAHIPGVRRAIAMKEIGRDAWADLELRYVWLRADPQIHPALLGLAARLNLPSTQVRGAKALEKQNNMVLAESVLYPIPAFEPQGGFTLDRALVFAFMRQESEFSAWAVSSAGARGLMQLMPATAGYIGRDRTLQARATSVKLHDPSLNISLGQRYIEYLLQNRNMSGNLLLTAAAYNGGPGNVNRWLQRGGFNDDPFLFLETIPLDETRDYVAKVMANLWVYHLRLGQPTPSLDALAEGRWPMYEPQDKITKKG